MVFLRKLHRTANIYRGFVNFPLVIHKCRISSKWMIPVGYNTNIKVFNSVTKTKVPLVLKSPNLATWYMCGPTVYDSAHIGHACSYVKFDIIRRILVDFFDLNVVLVMGITDIDDKIIHRASERNEDIKTITSFYETEFREDMISLNVRPPTITTRVTDYIPQIIKFVENIVERGQGYVTDDGSVYFDTAQFDAYGKLFPASETDEKSVSGKRSALDFALWKGAKPGEPFWNSPWGTGKGRPGWHIECSTMASIMLGNNIDLHTGGIDLLFPHHENEEAQSCVHHDVPQWVNYWLHAGHLNLKDDVKMSKSLKNTITIRDFLEKYTANEFRVFCLLSRYRNGVEFSESSMENAVAICKKMTSFLNDCEAYIQGLTDRGEIDSILLEGTLESTKLKLQSSLADDFDTSKSMAAVLDLISVTNKMLHDSKVQQDFTGSPALVAAVASFVSKTMKTFGVSLAGKQDQEVGKNTVHLQKILDNVIEFRTLVRETALNKSIAKKEVTLLKSCDSLRDNLAVSGVNITDHGKMSSWRFSDSSSIEK